MVPSWSITNISGMTHGGTLFFSQQKGNLKKQSGTCFLLFLTFFYPTFFLTEHKTAPWNPGKDVVKQLTLELLEWKCKSCRAVDKDFLHLSDINVDVVTSCSTKKRLFRMMENCSQHCNYNADLWIIAICPDAFQVTKPFSTTGRNIYLPIYRNVC